MADGGRVTASASVILGASAASLAVGALARQCWRSGASRAAGAVLWDEEPRGEGRSTSSTAGDRLVFVTGASGSGKTTLGEALREFYGFVHVDGDRWTAGLDPVTDGLPPSQEELQTEVHTRSIASLFYPRPPPACVCSRARRARAHVCVSEPYSPDSQFLMDADSRAAAQTTGAARPVFLGCHATL